MRIGINFVNYGVDIENGEYLMSEMVFRIVKIFMMICGMYDVFGEFVIKVGIFVKFGVGGGIMVFVLGCMGIGVYGFVFDKKGNSVVGVKVLEELLNKFKLNIF